MIQLIRILAILSLLALLSACTKTEPTTAAPSPSPSSQPITSESVVKAAALPVEVTAGGSVEATVRLTIQAGYHINANPPSFSYLRATALDVSPAEGVSLGFVTYPKALNKKFAFAETPLAVYEGETDLKANLKTDKAAKPGQRSIPATVRIQACDEQVCYAPGELKLSIPVNIK
jgi:DsbC/DsbD-like thiol-disulfide interchange protein